MTLRQKEPEHAQAPSFDWVFWLKWVLVSSLGWLLGILLPQEGTVAIGLAMGLLQWIVLRNLIPQAGWWIAASGLGWALGFLVTEYLLPAEIVVLQGAFLGLFMGLLQWLVLRQKVRLAAWWILVSALGWAIGPILGLPLVGAVVGATTGLTLELLTRPLRHEPPPEPEPEPAPWRNTNT